MRLGRRILWALLCVAIFTAIFVVVPGSVLATTFYSTNTSTSVGTAIGNAVELSQKAYPSGAPAAVVTNADDWAEAAGSGVLARACAGPLLLSSSTSLASGVTTELNRLRPAVVYVVGLSPAMAAQIDSALAGVSPRPQIVPILGGNEYETAALVAQQVRARLGGAAKVVIVPADYVGGVMAASAMAAANGWPILLSTVSGPFPQTTENAIAALGATTGICVGTQVGPSSSGFSVEARLVGTPSSADPDARVSLSALTSGFAVDHAYSNASEVALTTSSDCSSSIAVSAFVAGMGGVQLLSSTSGLSPEAAQFMQARGRDIATVDVVGLSWAIVRQVKSLNSAKVYSVSPGTGGVAGGEKVVVTGVALDTAESVVVGKTPIPVTDWQIDSSSQLTILATPAMTEPGPTEVIVENYWNRSPASTGDLYRYSDGSPVLPGDRAVNEALKYLGVHYQWAGASPSEGFDCSGLAMYVYGRLGITLPHYSRAQASYGTPVAKADLMPGDLVFFYNPIGHVGIYVGNGLMINAPCSGDLVTIEDVYRSSYATARRLLPTYDLCSDDNSRLLYEGSWGVSRQSSAIGGSFHYVRYGGRMVVTFDGTYLEWIAKTGPQYGQARVSVDGGAYQIVDLYTPVTLYQRSVWNTGSLSPGVHTAIVEWAGTKNSAGTSYYVSVDGLRLRGTLIGPLRFQQTDSRIVYSGAWFNSALRTFKWANGTGASAKVCFKGTAVSLYGKKAPRYGMASVSLDGGAPVDVDFFCSYENPNQLIFAAQDLADTNHTLTITWQPKRNAASTGTYINLDSVLVQGYLIEAPAPLIQQTDPRVSYVGPWHNSILRTLMWANGSGAVATITFQGTGIDFYATTKSRYGIAAMSLDGGAPVDVDFYSSYDKRCQMLYSAQGLENKTHTLTITWQPKRNAASTGTYIDIDFLIVNEM